MPRRPELAIAVGEFAHCRDGEIALRYVDTDPHEQIPFIEWSWSFSPDDGE